MKFRSRLSNSAQPNLCFTAGSITRIAASENISATIAHLGRAPRGVLRPRPVAYFSAEFGLHESIPIYSGGLGILAGDHIKSASDLDIPLVGIGLFYGQGYFRQRLDAEGWQQEEYIENDVNQLPMEPRSARTANRFKCRSIRARARFARACGASKLGVAICCCSIPTSKATRRKIAN